MKVNIGKYKNDITVYRFCDKLKYIGIPDDKCDMLGEYLSGIKWISRLLELINKKRKRKIKVEIHPYDVWSMDHTLSLVIAPMLKQLKDQKHGSGMVDDEDVPSEYATADVHERWDWVLNEMIYAFTEIKDDESEEFMHSKDKRERVQNGIRLFAKYYFSLWD